VCFGGELKHIKNFAPLFLVAGLIIALDQWTKTLVRTLPLGKDWLPAGMEWLSPYARVVHIYNTGAAFGSFTGFSWVFTVLAFVVVGLIIYYYPQVEQSDWWLKLAMGMQMGGALGNVVDRVLRNGQVTDFISVGNFAVFNVADASISVGVVILLVGVWLKEKKERKNAPEPTAVEPGLQVQDESTNTGEPNGG
jgi:signal peptidase II